MKREKRLTKKDRKALSPSRPQSAMSNAARQQQQHNGHIHCIACGKHLDVDSFGQPAGADFIRCDHGGEFPHCSSCQPQAKKLVEDHDRNGTPVQKAAIWH